MPTRSPADFRNIVLSGGGGSGKTSIAERLLFATGVTKRLGTIAEGNTVSDFTDEERRHKHSLQPCVLHFEFEGHLVNLIDTPGLVDFLGHTVACFPAAETIAVVIDAAKGIDNVARRLMSIAESRRIPRMIIVNKIDDPDIDLAQLTASIRATFGSICLPINLPSPDGSRVINVFEHDGNDSAGDDTLFSSVHESHKQIVEQVIEVDDELTMQYLEKGEGFDPEKLHAAFEKALEDAHLVPICFCSAKTGVGIDDLLHIFASLCPSPVEVNPPEFVRRETSESEDVEWHAKPIGDAKVLAHIFKVTTDPFVGKLGIFRVHQGTVKAKSELLIDNHKKAIRIGHLYMLQGKEHIEVPEIGPGGIGAIAKIDDIYLNGCLHDSHELDSVHLLPLPLPTPMYGLAIELKNHADETKFSSAVHKLIAEDPSLFLDRIAATGQTVLRGLGELHLRVVIEKLKHQAQIEILTSPPKVAYKETITVVSNGHHRHKKQTGGSGQFGEVSIRVEPLPPGSETSFEFATQVVGGAVPRQYWPAVEKGIRQVLLEGVFAGYPMTGVRAILTDGKYHDVDSKEIAFVAAGRKAFTDAVLRAHPAIMEPFVTLEVFAPSRHLGDITGHLSTKRGRVLSSDLIGIDNCRIQAVAPMAELQNYANELKSMTGGAGSFTMDFSHDERTPANVQAALIAAYKPKSEQD